MKKAALRVVILSVTVLGYAASASAHGMAPAEQVPSVQQLFEAGQYDRAAEAIAALRREASPPPVLADAYLAGQVFLRLNQPDRAKQEFARLTSAADPVWRLTGESAVALADRNFDGALDRVTEAATQLAAAEAAAGQNAGPAAARRPVEAFHVSYQTGLVKAARMEWAGAAAAFERAALLQPTFAYAHYYAGLAYSNIRRPDQVALHFERFLSLAPNAPERPAVLSIMRTIRGR